MDQNDKDEFLDAYRRLKEGEEKFGAWAAADSRNTPTRKEMKETAKKIKDGDLNEILKYVLFKYTK